MRFGCRSIRQHRRQHRRQHKRQHTRALHTWRVRLVRNDSMTSEYYSHIVVSMGCNNSGKSHVSMRRLCARRTVCYIKHNSTHDYTLRRRNVVQPHVLSGENRRPTENVQLCVCRRTYPSKYARVYTTENPLCFDVYVCVKNERGLKCVNMCERVRTYVRVCVSVCV